MAMLNWWNYPIIAIFPAKKKQQQTKYRLDNLGLWRLLGDLRCQTQRSRKRTKSRIKLLSNEIFSFLPRRKTLAPSHLFLNNSTVVCRALRSNWISSKLLNLLIQLTSSFLIWLLLLFFVVVVCPSRRTFASTFFAQFSRSLFYPQKTSHPVFFFSF